MTIATKLKVGDYVTHISFPEAGRVTEVEGDLVSVTFSEDDVLILEAAQDFQPAERDALIIEESEPEAEEFEDELFDDDDLGSIEDEEDL